MSIPLRQALVLGGGGILGVAWEVGILAAIEERLGRGAVARDFDLLVGSSAGAIVASLVGQGVPPADVFAALTVDGPSALFRPADVCRLDAARLLSGCLTALTTMLRTFGASLRVGRLPTSLALFESAQNGLPAGFLSLEPLAARLAGIYAAMGLRNDFRKTRRPLLVPALDIDRGERVLLGSRSLETRPDFIPTAQALDVDPPLAQAVTASASIPRLFGAVAVGGRMLVDGDIGGALHLDAALEQGCRRILALSPVAASCLPATAEGACGCRPVSRGGLGELLDQCSRIEQEHAVAAAVDAVHMRWADADVLLIKPPRTAMPSAGPMSWEAYRPTLERARRSLDTLDAESLRRLDMFARRRSATPATTDHAINGIYRGHQEPAMNDFDRWTALTARTRCPACKDQTLDLRLRCDPGERPCLVTARCDSCRTTFRIDSSDPLGSTEAVCPSCAATGHRLTLECDVASHLCWEVVVCAACGEASPHGTSKS